MKKPWLPALILLMAVLVINLAVDPRFFAFSFHDGRLFGSLVDILVRAAPTLIIAAGMTLVIASGGVDLSVGAVAAISGATASCLIARPEYSPLVHALPGAGLGQIITTALFIGLFCGLLSGLLISRLKLQPIVATLLFMAAGRGIAQLITAGNVVTTSSTGFAQLAHGSLLGIPNPVWIAAFIVCVMAAASNELAIGKVIAAVGSSRKAAEHIGIKVGLVLLLIYGITGLLSALAGLIWSSDLQACDANSLGLYSELDAILAVAVGGTMLTGGRYSILGTAIGALLMQTVTTTLLTHGIGTQAALILKAFIVVGVCVLQSPVWRERVGGRATA